MAPHLAGDATVVLDDVQRPGERDIVRRWTRDHGWPLIVWPAEGVADAVMVDDGYAT